MDFRRSKVNTSKYYTRTRRKSLWRSFYSSRDCVYFLELRLRKRIQTCLLLVCRRSPAQSTNGRRTEIESGDPVRQENCQVIVTPWNLQSFWFPRMAFQFELCIKPWTVLNGFPVVDCINRVVGAGGLAYIKLICFFFKKKTFQLQTARCAAFTDHLYPVYSDSAPLKLQSSTGRWHYAGRVNGYTRNDDISV